MLSVSGIPLGKGVKLIKEHRVGLFALEKPAGVLSHPENERSDSRALLECPYNTDGEYYEWKNPANASGLQRVYLLHRLDSPTSGIILVATEGSIARYVKKLFENRQVSKTYVAAVKGTFSSKGMLWNDQLTVSRKNEKVRSSVAGRGRKAVSAVTQVKKLAVGTRFKCSLLEFSPKTGRSHQLRVQCAHRHFPIIGDRTYGDFGLNKRIKGEFGIKRLCLHASGIQVKFKAEGCEHSFAVRSSIPKEFSQLVK